MGHFFLRFVSILFLIIEKGISKRLGKLFSRFVSILFLIFGKGGKLKIGLGSFSDLTVYFLKIF